MKIIDKIKNKISTIFDKSGNKQILQISYFFAVLFVMLIIYLIVFMFKDSDRVINNSYNKREELYTSKTIRGQILDRNNEVLAFTDISSGSEKRVYPYGDLFAHVVGYNSKGKAGIENIANFKLIRSNILFTERLFNEANGIKSPGDNVYSTLDANVQYAAYSALGDRRGAVTVMDAKSGEILAMVSKPDFDPNEIDGLWDIYTSNEDDSRLLNRATQGMYPPGSTFKILTALEYIRENEDIDKYDFDCSGAFEYKGTTINCYHKISHGNIDFDKSFAKSCNASFANITTKLNKNKFRNTCEDLLFNKTIPCPFNATESFVPINSKSSVDELMQTGIGQGRTSITPYHMCLISASIANDGMLMSPYIIKEIRTSEGDIVERTMSHEYKRLISSEDSVKLKVLMRDVVTEGTGTKLLDTTGYTAYGKTGSAEFSSNKSESHAWFIGFSEGEDGRVIAISVIIENGGSGGQIAVPVAKSVFDAIYR